MLIGAVAARLCLNVSSSALMTQRSKEVTCVMPYSIHSGLIFLMLLGSLFGGSATAQGTSPNTAFLIPDQVSTMLRARGYSESIRDHMVF